MPIKLYNHLNSPEWCRINRRIDMKNNGAVTYSKNITRYYWPVFAEVFKNDCRDIAVVTVTREQHPVKFNEDLIFCFRHECRFRQQPTIAACQAFAAINKRVVFIVWDEDCAIELTKHKLNAIFLPMGIDVKAIRAYKTQTRPYADRIIYFGNVRNKKTQAFYYLKTVVQRHGWYLDRISGDRLNGGPKLSREQIFRIIQKYKYGVGVGICAHEMAALGLKTYIYAYSKLGHLPKTQQEGQFLLHRNLCSPELATVPPLKAIQQFPSSVIIEPRDIRDNQDLLIRELLPYS